MAQAGGINNMTQTVIKQLILCPYCGFSHVLADGKHGDRAYYLCRDCDRRFSIPFDRDIISTLPEGVWSGRRVFIFGGGASIQTFDFKQLNREDRTIAINTAWKSFYNNNLKPNLQFSGDQAFWKSVSNDLLFRKVSGIVAALDHNKTLDVGLLIRTKEENGYWGSDFREGIRWGQNSGVAALNLAEVLGAEEVHLVGFDLDGTNREGLVFEGVKEMHALFLERFREVAPYVKCKVIIHNSKSPLNKIKWGKSSKRLRKKRSDS